MQKKSAFYPLDRWEIKCEVDPELFNLGMGGGGGAQGYVSKISYKQNGEEKIHIYQRWEWGAYMIIVIVIFFGGRGGTRKLSKSRLWIWERGTSPFDVPFPLALTCKME